MPAHVSRPTARAAGFPPALAATLSDLLGIPGNPDADTILAALDEALAESATGGAEQNGIPQGYVSIPASHLEELTAAATAAEGAVSALHDREREQLLNSNQTKYLPASRAAWSAEYDRDPVATTSFFAAAPDIVSPAELQRLGVRVNTADAQAQTLDDVTTDPAYQAWKF